MQHPGSATERRSGADPNEGAAAAALLPVVYDELRRMAHHYLRREAADHTLGTTELVHEAYLRLAGQTSVQWTGRAHFLGIAATAMRRILVDHARDHRSLKRGGALARVPLERAEAVADQSAELLLALDDALERLRARDARQARVVECRFFGGMTEEETAEALGIGLRTAKRDWAKARSWLYRELYPDACV